jgi:hypothetical protein
MNSELYELLDSSFKIPTEKALEKMITLNFAAMSDNEIIDCFENFVAEHGANRRTMLNGQLCKKIKKYKTVVGAEMLGDPSTDYILNHVLFTVEFWLQYTIHKIRAADITRSRENYQGFDRIKCGLMNDKLKSFTVMESGEVKLKTDQKAEIIKMIKSLNDNRDWLKVSPDIYFWLNPLSNKNIHAFDDVLMLAITQYYGAVEDISKDMLTLLTNSDMLNSMIIKCYNDNQKFGYEFEKELKEKVGGK